MDSTAALAEPPEPSSEPESELLQPATTSAAAAVMTTAPLVKERKDINALLAIGVVTRERCIEIDASNRASLGKS
ncbi:hypothetical protein GOALK_094_00110 [Gordonia alkanivorans NBRC 16433]|uniref:Uncharacterized protein n=1 Tax=Gordonia alkanivorans NBRC 16433 TaxID=1027371 RepID=F9VZ63_9ACTN|nr:hypothetical protein GOALK_094_00110 [Gordonia alkanivorans NBRC 16433]